MRLKIKSSALMLFSIALLTQILVPAGSWTEDDHVFDAFGPRVDNLVINMYEQVDTLMGALQAGEVDVADWVVPAEWRENWSIPPFSDPSDPDYIEMGPVKEMAVFEFDLNHKEEIPSQSGYTNPMTYQKFRQAIAHLTNKTGYVSDILKGEAVVWDTMIPPWTFWYNQLCNDYYTYDINLARAALDSAGFSQIPGAGLVPGAPPGSDEWRQHPQYGSPMLPLYLYIRAEHPDIMAAGLDIADKLRFVGIPTTVYILPLSGCYYPVFIDQDYHLYTGYQRVWKDPDYLYDLYGGHAINWPNHMWYDNADFNEAAAGIKYATAFAQALQATKEAQLIMTYDVCNIPLWGYVGYKAQRGYDEFNTNKPWHGFVNEEGIGKNSWWTFLSAHTGDAATGGTIFEGLRSRPLRLNPMRADTIWPTRSSTYCEWEIMNKIYDSLLREDPYTFEDMSWLAHSWYVGTYYNIALGKECTTLNFRLEEDVYWHDGVHFTSDDVKFSIEYQRENMASWWGKLMDVYQVQTPDDYTVVVLMSVKSMWALHWIGEIPILPKHVWETITGSAIDANMPDPNLIGTGPFKYEGGEPGTEPGTGVVPQEYVTFSSYESPSLGYFRWCPIKAMGGINMQGGYVLPENRDVMKRTMYMPCGMYGNVIYPELNTIIPIIKCKNLHATTTPAWTGTWIVTETTGTGYSDAETITVASQGPPVTIPFDIFSIAGDPNGVLPYTFTAIHTADSIIGRTCSYTLSNLVKAIIGDINGDGVVNLFDALELNLAFILWINFGIYYANADLNGDGCISVLDAIVLVVSLLPPVIDYYAVIAGEGYTCAYADNDAYDMYNALTSYGNWNPANIKLLVSTSDGTKHDCTIANIQSEISWMARVADGDDICVFFYAGHGGYQDDVPPIDEADGHDEYICPEGGNILDDELYTWMSAIRGGKLVALDSCYSGGFPKGDGMISRSVPDLPRVEITDGFARDLDKPGWNVHSACDEGELSYGSGALQNGVFTYYFVEGLYGPADTDADGDVDALEAHDYTSPLVIAYMGGIQHPCLWCGSPFPLIWVG